jgi:hypothetical protein
VRGNVQVFHVEDLKPFYGPYDEAYRVALNDNDQHVILRILAYLGDLSKRTSLDFKVMWHDGSVTWEPWSRDLYESLPFETYCRSKHFLTPLVHPASTIIKQHKQLKATPVTSAINFGDVCYVDLLHWGSAWFHALNLPDTDTKTYVVKSRYGVKNKKMIEIHFILFGNTTYVDNVWIQLYGSIINMTEHMVEVTSEFANEYPQVMQG